MNKNDNKYINVIRFILGEKWLTITVIGSVITFQFISSFKNSFVDPLLDYTLPVEKFEFMDVTIRDGEETVIKNPKLTLKFGDLIREFIKWGFVVVILYLLAKYTSFPETDKGNFTAAAIM